MIIECDECKKEVSSQAKICVHCGCPNIPMGDTSGGTCIALGILDFIILVVGILIYCAITI